MSSPSDFAEDTGVRRMMSVAGSDSDFDLAREQIETWAAIQVSAKSVERHAEQIGAEIIRIEQAEIKRSVQLQLPIPMGDPIPVLYVEIDGLFPGQPLAGSPPPFFFLHGRVIRFSWPQLADLGVDFNELPVKVLEVAELGNLALGFAHG